MEYTAILAGGEGSRLMKQGFKPLIQIGEKSLLQISLERLLPVTENQLFILFNENGRKHKLESLSALHDSKINFF